MACHVKKVKASENTYPNHHPLHLRRITLLGRHIVDGCFWHACPKHSNLPVNNRPFWRRKLSANKKRDLLVIRTLRKTGWSVLRIWEHELSRKNETRLHRALL